MRGSGRAKRTKRLVLACISLAVVVAIVVCLGVLNANFPFASFLPAYGIPARGEGEMRLHFLSVGQGDCTVVEFPNGTAFVVDAGDGTSSHHITRYLKGLDVSSYIFIATHADADHCGGFSALFKHVKADMVYLPSVDSAGNSYHALLESAEREGVPTGTLARYDALGDPEGGYAVCVSPYRNEEGGNDASTVLYVSYAGVNILLGADISSVRETVLQSEAKLMETIFDSGDYEVRLAQTDILKVSHHGAEGSSSAEWLSLLDVKTAIISCGKGNSYGHPAGETVERLAASSAEIYRTDELGDVMAVIPPDGAYRLQTNYRK